MHIVRYVSPGSSTVRVGVADDESVAPLQRVDSLASLLALRLETLPAELTNVGAAEDLAHVTLLAPIDGRTEVWACGVTYEISREARITESETSSDVYAQVYEAERPELFFKSAAWRVIGDGQAIGVRDDSAIDVPEPEVALVVNSSGEIIGVTVCNDVSSRTIEGENPLYLPQAKIYLGGCALGPAIRPIWEVGDLYMLDIELSILRSGVPAWSGRASTSQLHRRLECLVDHLMRADLHPDGAVLSTGTCLVPESPFSLQDGDEVRISVAKVGVLRNRVVRGLQAMKQAFGKPAQGRPILWR